MRLAGSGVLQESTIDRTSRMTGHWRHSTSCCKGTVVDIHIFAYMYKCTHTIVDCIDVRRVQVNRGERGTDPGCNGVLWQTFNKCSLKMISDSCLLAAFLDRPRGAWELEPLKVHFWVHKACPRALKAQLGMLIRPLELLKRSRCACEPGDCFC